MNISYSSKVKLKVDNRSTGQKHSIGPFVFVHVIDTFDKQTGNIYAHDLSICRHN